MLINTKHSPPPFKRTANLITRTTWLIVAKVLHLRSERCLRFQLLSHLADENRTVHKPLPGRAFVTAHERDVSAVWASAALLDSSCPGGNFSQIVRKAVRNAPRVGRDPGGLRKALHRASWRPIAIKPVAHWCGSNASELQRRS